jgi:hypothetical protein
MDLEGYDREIFLGSLRKYTENINIACDPDGIEPSTSRI